MVYQVKMEGETAPPSDQDSLTRMRHCLGVEVMQTPKEESSKVPQGNVFHKPQPRHCPSFKHKSILKKHLRKPAQRNLPDTKLPFPRWGQLLSDSLAVPGDNPQQLQHPVLSHRVPAEELWTAQRQGHLISITQKCLPNLNKDPAFYFFGEINRATQPIIKHAGQAFQHSTNYIPCFCKKIFMFMYMYLCTPAHVCVRSLEARRQQIPQTQVVVNPRQMWVLGT